MDKMSQLVGATTKAVLKIDNNGTGSALQLLVEPGNAPLTVSATAGKTTNLDADKLDGKDSGEFLAADGKAADAAHADQADQSNTATNAENADHADTAGSATTATNADSAANAQNAETLDGKDSSQFMTASTYRSVSPSMAGTNIGNGSGTHAAYWQCDAGDRLLSGGYAWSVNSTNLAVTSSHPSGNTWHVSWGNTANPNQPYEMEIYVLCADTAAPAHG